MATSVCHLTVSRTLRRCKIYLHEDHMSIKLWQKVFLVWWRVWVLQVSITSTFPWCAVTRRTSTVNLVDTGRKLNVHKTIRTYPGHLLNVVCTFNLRPVSTGKSERYTLLNSLTVSEWRFSLYFFAFQCFWDV